jgi:hypothetical protein
MASSIDTHCWTGHVPVRGLPFGAAVKALGGTCATGNLPNLQRI